MPQEPLAARMRPRTFEEFLGQGHLVGEGKVLSKLVRKGHLPSLILWGPAGTGKTTLARLLSDAVSAPLMQLSAVNSGVADARKVMDGASGCNTCEPAHADQSASFHTLAVPLISRSLLEPWVGTTANEEPA